VSEGRGGDGSDGVDIGGRLASDQHPTYLVLRPPTRQPK
jgi:hypothetical protein